MTRFTDFILLSHFYPQPTPVKFISSSATEIVPTKVRIYVHDVKLMVVSLSSSELTLLQFPSFLKHLILFNSMSQCCPCFSPWKWTLFSASLTDSLLDLLHFLSQTFGEILPSPKSLLSVCCAVDAPFESLALRFLAS